MLHHHTALTTLEILTAIQLSATLSQFSKQSFVYHSSPSSISPVVKPPVAVNWSLNLTEEDGIDFTYHSLWSRHGICGPRPHAEPGH